MQAPPPPGSNDPRLHNLMQLLSAYTNGQGQPPPGGSVGSQGYNYPDPQVSGQSPQQQQVQYAHGISSQLQYQPPGYTQQVLHKPYEYATQTQNVNHHIPMPVQASQAPAYVDPAAQAQNMNQHIPAPIQPSQTSPYDQTASAPSVQIHNQQSELPLALLEALLQHFGTGSVVQPPPTPRNPHTSSIPSSLPPAPASLPPLQTRQSLLAARPAIMNVPNSEVQIKTTAQEEFKAGIMPNGDQDGAIKDVQRSETLNGADDENDEEDDDGEPEAGADNRQGEEPPTPAPKVERRVQVVMTRWNEDASKWEDVEIEVEKAKTGGFSPSAFLRKQMDIDNDKKTVSEELEIHSQDLKALLKDASPWWRDISTDPEPPLIILAPFQEVVWRWELYLAACEARALDTEAEKNAKSDLREVLELIKASRALKSYFRSRDTINTTKMIKHEHLWTLFPHGTRVVTKSYMDQIQLFEVETAADDGKSFKVACRAFDWDGNNFNTYSYDFQIKYYSGEIPITNLDIYPFEFHNGPEGKPELRQKLMKRGKKYVSLCTQEPGAIQCEYQGTAFVVPTAQHRLTSKGRRRDHTNDSTQADSDDFLKFMSVELTGPKSRVIIDNFAFMKSKRNTLERNETPPLGRKECFPGNGCVCGHCKSSVIQKWRDAPKPHLSLEGLGRSFVEDEERLLFLPPRLLGYALNDRVWGQFLVNKLTPVSFAVDNDIRKGPFWDELELEQGHKEHLIAFVKHHRASAAHSKSLDIIDGKGEGLVILLHGPPGVGKTLTAETIAIATNRPLLTVSVAEIGVDYREAEHNLTEMFADAARWEAVLLMDEADIFVEQRTPQADMARNALVSVMLRCLEYFEGIIIMTTNRVKAIDAAIQSRIQLAIQFHDLSEQQRMAIYTNRLKHVPDDEFENRKELTESLKTSPLIKIRQSEEKPNGRQIRNIVTYARALAKHEKASLNVKHLLAVAETTSAFMESMKDTTIRTRVRNEADWNN